MLLAATVLGFLWLSGSGLGNRIPMHRRSKNNAIPDYPFDPDTTKYCAWWIDGDGVMSCNDVEELFGVSLQDFLRWNPSAKSSCNALPAETSFCVAAPNERRPKTVTSASVATTATQAPATPTAPANAIVTPGPIQAGMVPNCKAFYWVKAGEGCDVVASKNGITVPQIVAWNPGAKSGCTELWANTYCCVGVL
ncbi:hypothetical protein GQ53DRAFT_817343 [Thozetella sp. PMI_491]|nr:hypothetical protein GQ53DRAFT_817343 [Thozetella sp. PMI_491]